MDIELITALISGITSFVVVIVTQFLVWLIDRKNIKEREHKCIQKEYINPLRFLLAENYFRIDEAINEEKCSNKLSVEMMGIKNPKDILSKNYSWFTKSGCYLISNCYYTACLFALLEQIRLKVPYLKLGNSNDTKIMVLINNIVVDFRYIANIYYVIQRTIGSDLYIEQEQRLLTYKEFCDLLNEQENLCWYSALIEFYLSIDDLKDFINNLLLADLKRLTEFLDNIVSGENTIEQKLEAERAKKNEMRKKWI